MTIEATGAPRTEPSTDPGGPRRAPRTLWRTLRLPALSLPPLALLAMASWFGRYVRPSADEWCFIPNVRDHGITGLIGTFYFTDNGRLGNGLLVGLYARFPVAGHQWFAPVSGVIILALLWTVTAQLLRAAALEAPPGTALLAASTMTAVFLFATPNTYKTFYWPAASVSHTLAPVLACAAVIPLLRARGSRGRYLALATVLAAGMFMATLSEEASVVALVTLSVLVLSAHHIVVPRLRRFVRAWSLTAMAGIGIGTLLLVTSPGFRTRRTRYDADRTSMLAPESLMNSLRGYVRILETVVTTWQYLGAIAVGVLIGLLVRGRTDRPCAFLPYRPLLLTALGALTVLVSGYLCTVITYPVFGARVVTTERTWNDYLLPCIFVLTATGAFAGRAVRHRARRVGATVSTTAAAAVCSAAVLALFVPLHGLGEDMRVRAANWDQQDRNLREQAEHGATVAPYKPLAVSKMLEPFSNGGRRVWPAQCVADYYHLEKVTHAVELPGRGAASTGRGTR
ncbi:DUF6056 family protein [Streptomyces chartreusis]|uniref:DUF6056 family protein n=1 Tax=Streptomyces chartreusis TaxID=1969 RepID=UPI00363C1076